MAKRKICIVTGTRAEYGLLSPLIQEIELDKNFQLQLLVTGMHLSPEFGLTYKEIERDGNKIDEKVEMLMSSDSDSGITKATGLGMIGFADSFKRLKPDLVVLLGDRYEIFAAAIAAHFTRIPIAHLHGGEATEGLIDEAIRHSITKLSQLHFTSTDEYRRRVIQLGEQPNRVFNVGAIGLDNIRMLKLLSKEELEKQLQFRFAEKNILITFHPVTLENKSAEKQFKELLKALKRTNGFLIFTKPNADADGRIIVGMIDEFVQSNKNRSVAFTSLGQLRYLSMLSAVDCVVGNSSSGIIEVPSFKIPTINIGDRQLGRIQSHSILNCTPEEKSISSAIEKAFSKSFASKISQTKNPYGNGTAATQIVKVLSKMDFRSLIKKSFYNISFKA